MRRIIPLIVTFVFLLSSCQKEESESTGTASEAECHVTVIHSPNGLGDRGYNDNIYYGIRKCKEEYDFSLSFYSPLNFDEAEQLMIKWMNDSIEIGKRMLILASSDLEAVLRKHVDLIPSQEKGEVLLLESRSTDLPVHTIYMPLYGACYQAGCTVMNFPYADVSAVVCANPTDKTVADGRTGFEDGFMDSGGMQLGIYYLSEDDRGYAMADSLYRLCYTLEQNYGFVFSLCGGSSQGLLRFTREYPYTFYTAGMDVDQSDYSSRVAFSVVKHIDQAVFQFLSSWIKGEDIPRHQRFGLSSGLVEVVVAPYYEKDM